MGKLRLGFSYWGFHDGLVKGRGGGADTPDGHRYGRPLFMNEILSRGHELVCLQRRREQGCFLGDIRSDAWAEYLDDLRRGDKAGFFPDLDVIFMEWRWSTYKNDRNHPNFKPDRYEPDLDRQLEVLEFYHGKVPIILWDTDLKITPDDENRWPEAILTDPSFETNRLTRDRVSLPFWTDWKELFAPVEYSYNYGYVGNRYEREGEFDTFFYQPAYDLRAHGIQTVMYGNWLQRSPERGDPADLISYADGVMFGHRMDFLDSMQLMNSFICTTHVSKPLYYEKRFVSPRYLEALAVGCPALTPYAMPNLLGDHYRVDCADDVVRRVKELASGPYRRPIIEEQRENLKRWGRFDVEHVIDFIESCVK